MSQPLKEQMCTSDGRFLVMAVTFKYECKQVCEYNYIIVRPKPTGLAQSATLTNTTTTSDCQTTSGQIPGYEPVQGIDGYVENGFDKRKFLRQECKMP